MLHKFKKNNLILNNQSEQNGGNVNFVFKLKNIKIKRNDSVFIYYMVFKV